MSAKEVALQQVPNSIKYGAAGLLVLLIGSILWFTSSSDDEESQAQAQSLFEIESSVQNLDAEIPVGEPVKPLEMINQTASLSDEIPPPYANLIKQSELKLSQLEEQLQQLSSENNNRQQDQDQLHKDLQAQLTAQSIKIQQLQDNLKARQLAAASTKNKPVKRYKKIHPPFTLVSIDQWGNDLYAVVRLQGQLHELTQGQTVNGWYVDSFDRTRNAVSFKNKAGTRRELFIKS